MDLWEFLLFLVVQRACSGLEVTVPLSPQTASPGSNVLLPCTFRVKDSTVNPNFLAVVWKYGEKELVKFDNKGLTSTLKASIDPQAALKGDATLTVHNGTVSDEGTYKCIVIYSPEMDQKTINLRLQATPSVKMTKKALLKNQENRLVCSATDFYPRAITITWLWNGQVLLTANMGEPQGNGDGTYSVNSSVILNPTETQEKQLIECQVEHESLGKPITDEYSVIYGEPPTVQIYSMEIPGRREKVVVCDVGGFYPEAITVNWKLDGKPLDSSSRDAVRTFNKRIYSHVRPSPNNEPEDFSCEVQHETLLSPITQTHQVRYFSDQDKSCHLGLATMLGMLLALAGVGVLLWFFIFRKKYFQRFMVSPIYGPQTLNDDDKVTFNCVAFKCPKDTWVTWSVAEGDGKPVPVSGPRTQDEEERLLGIDYTIRTDQSGDKELHKVITALNFTPSVLKHSNATIVCKFTSNERTKEEKMKWSFTLPKPQVSDENPIALSPGDSSDVICSTELKNFNPKDIGITWSCGAGHYQDLETFKEEVTQNSQQTYDAKSECRIPGHRFTEPGFKVRVTWIHKSMQKPEWKEASAADLPLCPHMSDISVPCLLHSDEVKLQCTISRYFPDALTVKWLRQEAGKPDLFPVSPSDKYKFPVEDVTRQEDQTFTCTASLIYTVSRKTDHGSEFICQVGHPSLERPLEKRTGELNVVGIPVVGVTLDDSQSDHWLIAEVRDFYPQNIDVRWSRTKHKGQYEEYPAPDFTKESKANPDGTFQLTSKCRAINFDDKKRFKVSVTHESMESPIEMIMMKREGGHFITGNGEERPLPKSSSLKEQSHPHHETTDKNSREETLLPSDEISEKSTVRLPGIPVVDVFLDDSQSDHWLIAEVRGFAPQNIDVKWSRTKSKRGYEEYPASAFTNKFEKNSDGTFQLTSKCKAKGSEKQKKSFKVSVTNESLESPIEMVMEKRKDGYFITGKEGERPLPKSSSLKKQSPPHHETTDKGSGRGDHQFENTKSSVRRNK